MTFNGFLRGAGKLVDTAKTLTTMKSSVGHLVPCFQKLFFGACTWCNGDTCYDWLLGGTQCAISLHSHPRPNITQRHEQSDENEDGEEEEKEGEEDQDEEAEKVEQHYETELTGGAGPSALPRTEENRRSLALNHIPPKTVPMGYWIKVMIYDMQSESILCLLLAYPDPSPVCLNEVSPPHFTPEGNLYLEYAHSCAPNSTAPRNVGEDDLEEYYSDTKKAPPGRAEVDADAFLHESFADRLQKTDNPYMDIKHPDSLTDLYFSYNYPLGSLICPGASSSIARRVNAFSSVTPLTPSTLGQISVDTSTTACHHAVPILNAKVTISQCGVYRSKRTIRLHHGIAPYQRHRPNYEPDPFLRPIYLPPSLVAFRKTFPRSSGRHLHSGPT
ncbi:hypothetical protein D9619_005133 [Psilocybe cf. subviscida]|uniref:Uncharacterized protein n=1 Tax=Psilocybe cf. subviscida TaxID=2480587 RepID=A0A8H5BQ52_9AGAR|nr:hypothetical protein D9619_005133 [Psilocybe cf. subviscida]